MLEFINIDFIAGVILYAEFVSGIESVGLECLLRGSFDSLEYFQLMSTIVYVVVVVRETVSGVPV